jgi:hypothetical protein
MSRVLLCWFALLLLLHLAPATGTFSELPRSTSFFGKKIKNKNKNKT